MSELTEFQYRFTWRERDLFWAMDMRVYDPKYKHLSTVVIAANVYDILSVQPTIALDRASLQATKAILTEIETQRAQLLEQKGKEA